MFFIEFASLPPPKSCPTFPISLSLPLPLSISFLVAHRFACHRLSDIVLHFNVDFVKLVRPGMAMKINASVICHSFFIRWWCFVLSRFVFQLPTDCRRNVNVVQTTKQFIINSGTHTHTYTHTDTYVRTHKLNMIISRSLHDNFSFFPSLQFI